MSRIVKERKFRKYRGGTNYCDKCERKIGEEEWHFARRKYKILKERMLTPLGVAPLTRLIDRTILCETCGRNVPKIKGDWYA